MVKLLSAKNAGWLLAKGLELFIRPSPDFSHWCAIRRLLNGKRRKKKKKDSIFSFNLITQSIVPGGKDLGAKINAQQCSVLHSFLIKNTVLIIQSEFSSSFFKSQIWGRGLAQ